MFVTAFLQRLSYSILNGRSVQAILANGIVNSIYIIGWVLLMVVTNKLPRPGHIFIRLLKRLDQYLFSTSYSSFGVISFVYCLLVGSWFLYLKKYAKVHHSFSNLNFKKLETYETRASMYDNEEKGIEGKSHLDNTRLIGHLNEKNTFRPYNCYYLAPPILLACSWLALNVLYEIEVPVSKPTNIVAYVFYALLHFFVPLGIGIWLYIFHPPGALRCFLVDMGLQNMLIVITQYIFPNAPPLFIKLYGESISPSYNMIYADGITRQDMKFGYSFYKIVYYATPNKFVCMPSTHSAVAATVFFFVCYYSRWTLFKVGALCYLFAQWWASLYLAHHWRLDLFVGLLYSVTVFTLSKNWKQGRHDVDEKFAKARLKHDFANGSTMGMRLFKSTRLQKFFDPFS